MDSMNLISVWLQCGNAQYALKSGSIMDTTIMIIFSMLLKMEHRSSLEAGREMFYNWLYVRKNRTYTQRIKRKEEMEVCQQRQEAGLGNTGTSPPDHNAMNAHRIGGVG